MKKELKIQAKLPSVNQMIDKLVTNAEQALAEYMQMSQDQVDEIVHSKHLPVG